MYQKTWSGDWRARVLERVRRLGDPSVTTYAARRAGVSLLELAEELGRDDVAAVQVMYLLVEEAIRTNTIPHALRDLFFRWLREAIPEGWKHPVDDQFRFDASGAISLWSAELADYLDRDATMSAGQNLLDAEFPTGWLPDGPDDPVIVTFVDRCLGRAPS